MNIVFVIYTVKCVNILLDFRLLYGYLIGFVRVDLFNMVDNNVITGKAARKVSSSYYQSCKVKPDNSYFS